MGMELGNFMGVKGIGSLVGSFFVLQFLGRNMFKSFVSIHFFAVAALLVFVLPDHVLISYLGLFIFGFFTIGISLAVRNILNAHTERADLGKVFSLFRVVVSLSSIMPLLCVDEIRRLLGSASNALLAATIFCLLMDAFFYIYSKRYDEEAVKEA